MRNPKWHRDEIILALNLYLSEDRGSIDASNPKVIELSKILNELPLFPDKPDKEKFRNANGVTLKMANFRAFDPEYKGTGMTSGSKLDKQVLEEFYWERKKLRRIAEEIKKAAADPVLKSQLGAIEEDEVTQSESVIEGNIIYKLHKLRERNKQIVLEKKTQVISQLGKLACEVCVFDFAVYYGDIGRGYIECHHRTPLAFFGKNTETRLEDLALVCSNCHRMIHRRIDTISIEDLRDMIKYNRE